MGNDDFEAQVTLARLETKMDLIVDLIVGPNLDGGKIAAIEGRLGKLEGRGAKWVGNLASSAVGAGVMVAFQKIFGH